ncbi:MAG: hypothetical protein U9Q73_00400 [Nanoarchaeota archaeon]|nr:hypothetical protein [Nanoarchaeota archaeon]
MEIEKGLFFDKLDLFILKRIFLSYKQKKEMNTWNLANDFIANAHGIIDMQGLYGKYKLEIDNIYTKIKRRVQRYQKFEILRIVNNGGNDKIFELDLDKISFAKHKFSDGFQECILIRIV